MRSIDELLYVALRMQMKGTKYSPKALHCRTHNAESTRQSSRAWFAKTRTHIHARRRRAFHTNTRHSRTWTGTRDPRLQRQKRAQHALESDDFQTTTSIWSRTTIGATPSWSSSRPSSRPGPSRQNLSAWRAQQRPVGQRLGGVFQRRPGLFSAETGYGDG